ncbi:alpha/beta fold hydrolase [Actinocorallia aurea]
MLAVGGSEERDLVLPSADVEKERPLRFASVDGVMIDAVINAPYRKSRGGVVLAHGITVDRDEGGMFVRLAERLAGVGFGVLRFSYRGHGESGGTQEGMTIAGEMLDLQAAVAVARTEFAGPLSLVAASFGAVSSCLSLPYLEGRLARLVLWNPVLDLVRTFVEPELPWGVENFGPDAQAALHDRGYLLVDDEFRLGRVLFEELTRYRPAEAFAASGVPALVVHGDRDSYVSYEIAARAAKERPGTVFHTIKGSDHGFDSREREDEAIEVTVDWLGA